MGRVVSDQWLFVVLIVFLIVVFFICIGSLISLFYPCMTALSFWLNREIHSVLEIGSLRGDFLS